MYADENIWLTQKMLGALYDVETHTINYHLKKVFADSELQEDSVIRNFRITATDGKSYNTKHYNLAAIIAVGYKVNSERTVLILGGGLINDVPLAELANRFQRVVLADILHLPKNRRRAEAVAPQHHLP